MSADLSDGPLQGLKVLELGQLLAGPYVGTLLGDFGAEVIKIEPPPAGDAMRDWGRLRHQDHSLWWSILARNKRSVTLNLRTGEGQEVARRLAGQADVVLENFRPGTMERWGLGPEDVHAVNPGAIYARVTGYGQTGRYRDRPGFASASEALSGLRHINGYPDQAPPRFGISLGDTLAAQSAFQGILLALYARDVRGATGQVVDASITDACLAITESAVLEYEKTGTVRNPTGTRLPRIAPSNVYRSQDGKWVVIAANHDTLWRRLATLIGRPELGEDERFATHHARGENEDLLDELISEWAVKHTAAELDQLVNDAGVVCAPVYDAADVYADPYFRERGTLIEYEDEVHGTVTGMGVIPRLTATPGRVRQAARWTVGADTDDVLRELGYDEGALRQLHDDDVI
jgi:crotonobetainyl-CoA:carnitine CoA-transferase CaiB-like acyl-CoA transferase